ncbi:Retrovirus-related Pol polyprotein from transposon TNT 1-94 [Senna tora]|uniref:Retrovirus-related Pol polyprotein from transposon TNT 1-94 n=1 Tax=Senna tora TaxID=362788 RepID=A0A834XD80_9FABA|nr:Retrovirus-related Pol polyprotein from transposon TNT 1-94 [Senna tora]
MEVADKDANEASSVLATLTNLASNSKFALQSLTQPISSKLDDNNYLSWRMLALATIRGHNLYNFLLGESHIPTRYATDQDRDKGTYNDEYLNWQCQDQLLASWLLNSMSDGVVSKMVGCVHSYQVWNKVEELFCSSTRARERELKNDLRSIKKCSTSMLDFLLKIKKIVDSLGAIGSPISTHDHIESIFDRLDREYESFMTSFSMRKEEYSVTEIEALLLSQEARIDKLKKAVDNVSANMAQRGGYQNNRFSNKSFGQRGGYQGRGNNAASNGGPTFFRGNFQGRGRGQPSSQPQNRGGGRQTWQGTRPQCQNFTPASLAQAMNQTQICPNSGAPVEALLATPEILSDDAWFADSSSSNHLTNNLSNLQVSQPYDGGEQVHIANGSELVYSDLWGPAPVTSSRKYRYYISFIDAFSKYTWVYLLKAKSDAFEAFQLFKSQAELQLNTKLLAFQSDYGGEYRPFSAFLKTHGIQHRLSCPHTHQQNGSAERKHRHITKLAATLTSLGFASAKCDHSLFTKFSGPHTLLVLVYVDDIIVTGSSSAATHDLISTLHSKFALKDLGPLHYFLGIQATSTPDGGMLLTQTKYIKDLLIRPKRGSNSNSSLKKPTSIVALLPQKVFPYRRRPQLRFG